MQGQTQDTQPQTTMEGAESPLVTTPEQWPVTPPYFRFPSTIMECESLLDLSQPDEFSDVVLLVEDQKLHFCRGILASASPVWKRMFVADFREKDAKQISLPGKAYADMQDVLYCIYPAIQKPISGENVLRVLPLADEYQMAKLKQDCENFLLCELASVPYTAANNIKYLTLAQRYSLPALLERTVEIAANNAVEELEGHEDFPTIDRDTLLDILTKRVRLLEVSKAKSDNATNTWQRKYDELQECLKKMSREKLTVKRALDELESAWELKGSDARCIDPVHIYGPRNYACDKCTRQVETYVQGKVWYLLNRGSSWSGISWPQ